MRHFKYTFVVLAAVTAFSTTGCQLMPHSLHPSQLRKLNRQPARDVSYRLQGQPAFTLADSADPGVFDSTGS